MGILRWILDNKFARKYNIVKWVANALPSDIVEDDRKRERDFYELRISGLVDSNSELERRLVVAKVDTELTTGISKDYQNRYESNERALNETNLDRDRLSGENERLVSEIGESKERETKLNAQIKDTKLFYQRHIQTAVEYLKLSRERARILENRFEERVNKKENDLIRDFEKKQIELTLGYREDLKLYEEALGKSIDNHLRRADVAEKQQVFLQGALERNKKEITEDSYGFASFLFKELGQKTSLSKTVGIILNRRLEPIYATPRFLEVNGMNENDLYKIKVPYIACSIKDGRDRSKIKYKDNTGKEHYGTIYSTPIMSRENEQIGTFIQIDQTFGDWLKQTSHLTSKKSNLIDLIISGDSELSLNG